MSEERNVLLPKFNCYADYSSANYGINALRFCLPGIDLFFSYRTIIAYRDCQDGLVVCENAWTTTTGKHLNSIDGGDKKSRKKYEEFHKMLKEALARHFVEAYKD